MQHDHQVAAAIDALIAERARAAFSRPVDAIGTSRDQLLADLAAGVAALQDLADGTARLNAGLALPPPPPPAAAAAPSPPAARAGVKPRPRQLLADYPASLRSPRADAPHSVGAGGGVSPRRCRDDGVRARRKLEEILDTPHSVHAHRGGWWSLDLRREGKHEVQLYRERGVARGADCVTVGRKVQRSRRGKTVQFRASINRELPRSAEGEEGKHCCDIRMSLDTFCSVFHSDIPEFNLVDAFQRGRVKAHYFGEGEMTGQKMIHVLETYLLRKIRGGECDRIVDSIRRGRAKSSRAAISDVFTQVVGGALERLGLWLVVTERVRCVVQWQVGDCTQLKSRRNLRVNNTAEINRIRTFNRSPRAKQIMDPGKIPLDIVKREHLQQEADVYNNSLKGRRRRRALEYQTQLLRNLAKQRKNGGELEGIPDIMDLIMTDFDPRRKRALLRALNDKLGMSKEDALYGMKFSLPYFLLRADMRPDAGEAVKSALEEAGAQILVERQFNTI